MGKLQKSSIIALLLLILAVIVIDVTYTYVKRSSNESVIEEKIEFKMSGGYNGGTCILTKKDPKKLLPDDAKQYLCDAYSVDPYQFYRYLYPTGGIYLGQVPNGDPFSKKIDANYYVDEHFVDVREPKSSGHEWLDIGCYYPEKNQLCNMGIKIFISGTSTYEVIPNI